MKRLLSIATALTVAAMIVGPGTASALTVDELTAQINALLATLATMQAQLAALQGGTPGTVGCTITSFARNLTLGSSGADVKCLQKVLNTAADTQVATTGVGSPGSETTYFGAKTKAAVVKFQTKYAISPVAGYVGPITRAKLNTLLSGGVIPPVVPTGAGLNVALASSTPVSSTLVSGPLSTSTSQSVAPLAKFTFTNGDATEVKVTQLKLKRLGVSADATLTNVYLFDGATRLTDAASVSSGVITFNDTTGLIKVAAGASKTVTVASDIANISSGQTVGVGVNAATDVVTNASTVTGTFPANGNLMSIASGTLATISFQLGTVTSPTAASVDPQNDYAIWQNTANVGTRAADLNRISFREIGSVTYTDLQNFRLYVDGTQVGAAVQSLDSNGYVTFDLTASPKRLEAGARVFKVLADIIGGSSKTFSLQLKTAADANLIDSQYNVTILPQVASSTFAAVRSCYNSVTLDYACTVNSGTITVTKKSDSPSGNIVNNASAATLAKYEVKSAGERVKIESLDVAVVCSNGGTAANQVGYLRNGMLLANGTQIGSTSNLICTAYTGGLTTFNLGSSLIVEPGSPVTLEVKADIYDNDGDNDIIATNTLQARIVAKTGNAQGLVSSASVNVPSAAKDGNQLTVQEGTLTLAKYTAWPNQTYVAAGQNLKLAHFTLTADTTEAVNISTIRVDLVTVTYPNVTSLYVEYGAAPPTSIKATTTASNSWSINYSLPVGKTIDMVVYGTVPSGYVSHTASRMDMLVSGTTAGSAASVCTTNINCTTVLAGQNLLFESGTITSAVDEANTPDTRAVAGNQTITAAKFKWTAANDDFTIKEVKVKLASNSDKVVQKAILKDGSTSWEAVYNPTNNFYFTGLNVSVPRNTPKTLTVDLVLSPPSAETGVDSQQKNIAVTLDWFKYSDSSGVQLTDATPRVAKDIYVFKSVPTFTKLDVGDQGANLVSGSNTTLYKFSVGASSQGEVNLKQLKFTVTPANGSTVTADTLSNFQFFRGSTNLTGTTTAASGYVTIQTTAGGTLETSTTITDGANTVVVTFDSEESIGAGATNTYYLKATPAGFTTLSGAKDTVSTKLNGDAAISSDTSLFYVYQTALGTVQRLATDNSAGGETAENIIWSDRSAEVTHDYTSGVSSADWANSLGTLLALPLDPQGISAP